LPYQLQFHSFADLWHPGVLAWVMLVQAAYLLVAGPMRQGYRWGDPIPPNRKFYFAMGLWGIYLSEGTPLHVMAEHYLFSAHMLQHLILTMWVSPLILAGMPAWMLRPLLRGGRFRAALRWLTRPVPALLLFNVVYSVWHMPKAYEAVLYSHGFHMVQHALLFLFAGIMWVPIVSTLPELPRSHELVQMGYIFLIGVTQMAVYGLITFADQPLYRFYEQAPRLWGISPMDDQQAAGVLMNLAPTLVLTVVWSVIFFRWAAREASPDLRPEVTK
jgi:putative membrane protein